MASNENGKETKEETEGNLRGCAGEGKQSIGNLGKEKRTVGVARYEFGI